MSITIRQPDPITGELFNTYKPILDRALQALHERVFFAQYPEMPKAYPENADAVGKTRFQEQLNQVFNRLIQSSDIELAAEEVSPYTLEPLGIKYPSFKSAESAVAYAGRAFRSWKNTHPNTRAAILIASLEKLKNDFFEIAYATMHTTGQGYMMAFQASGPHGCDRALESIALGWQEQTRYPLQVTWDKPMGKTNAVVQKYFRIIPRGINLCIGCSTFPLWNTLPGIYAGLVTGNAVIVKPHPKAIYPLAIAVAALQQVMKEYGFDPNTALLVADTAAKPLTKDLAEHPDVKLIDYTGGTQFGNWIETLPNKITFTEKAGVNSVIIDSTPDLKGMCDNLAFSICLYSGQMCTAPQNIFVPKDGFKAGDEMISYDTFVQTLIASVTALVNNPKAAPVVLGAIQNEMTCNRVEQATKELPAKLLLASQPVPNPEFPKARTASPAIFEVASKDVAVYSSEMFGPIMFIIPTADTNQSIERARSLAQKHGAISCAAYTTNPEIMQRIADEMADTATAVSFNLTGQVYVNQNAAFSDFHLSGGNPAGNASFTNTEFVAKRFTTVGIRIQ